MTICVLTIRDGRDEVHDRSMASIKECLPEPEHHVVIDDSDHELGFAGAIQAGWTQAIETGADYVFHHEADFLFLSPVPVEQMAYVLKARPHLVQMALKRQPVNEREKEAGGIVEADPKDFRQHTLEGHVWTEHRKFFTTNPSLYPMALCHLGWPQGPESEGHFWLKLAPDLAVRSAFWGAKFAPPMVTHIGERVGVGY